MLVQSRLWLCSALRGEGTKAPYQLELCRTFRERPLGTCALSAGERNRFVGPACGGIKPRPSSRAPSASVNIWATRTINGGREYHGTAEQPQQDWRSWR